MMFTRNTTQRSLLVAALLGGASLFVAPSASAQATASVTNPNDRAINWTFWKKKKSDAAPADSTSSESKMEKNYKKITGEKSTRSEGMFTVYKQENDYYFEIPTALLNRDMLVVNKLQKVPGVLNEAGVNKAINYESNLIRFEHNPAEDENLLFRLIAPKPYYPEGDAIGRSVEENYISSLVGSVKVEAYNADSTSCIIKVNDLYTGAEKSINNVFDNLGLGTSPIAKLSKIESIKSFDNNVIVTAQQTTKVTEGQESIHVTVEVSSSLVLLPEEPMTGRLLNNRVGYFSVPQLVYGDDQYEMETRELITRWRLEPRPEDREAYLRGELVEPQKPITFYIDNATPEQWRKYMIQGVEDWQVAFEKAGFKNAIRAIQLPDTLSPDMDDMNYSVINYIASAKVNAMGPSISDPRSGEIIEADIIWWHNVMTMVRQWIIVQTGAVNPDAQTYELPEALMGDAMRFVACHEVGHSLGLRHNMRGSDAFPTDSLRSKTFTDAMGSTAASIMDYARFNYVAQPGDNVTQLSPNIGIYDIFAIEYGYRWSGATRPEEEKEALASFLQAHDDKIYQFSESQDSRNAVDPRALSENLGDNTITASQYGIANLKRVMPQILNWTTTGESLQNYANASDIYYGVIGQWNNYLYHVLANIGGIYLETTAVGDGKESYTFVPRTMQQDALQFLLDEVFTNPTWLFETELNKYTYPMSNSPMGKVEHAPSLLLNNVQSYLLWDLLTDSRIVRMLNNERYNAKDAFTAVEMMDQLHRHIFSTTLRGANPDIATRNLQKNFVDALIIASAEGSTFKGTKMAMGENILESYQQPRCSHDNCLHHTEQSDRSIRRIVNFSASQSDRISDAASIKRGELLRIKDLLKQRINSGNTASRYHYQDIIMRIDTALGTK